MTMPQTIFKEIFTSTHKTWKYACVCSMCACTFGGHVWVCCMHVCVACMFSVAYMHVMDACLCVLHTCMCVSVCVCVYACACACVRVWNGGCADYLGGVGPHSTVMQFLKIDPRLYGLKLSWPRFDVNDPFIWKINIDHTVLLYKKNPTLNTWLK